MAVNQFAQVSQDGELTTTGTNIKSVDLEGKPAKPQSPDPASEKEPLQPAITGAIAPISSAQPLISTQAEETELTQMLAEIGLRLRQCFDLDDLFRTAVKEARRSLRTDRVLVFKFDLDNWDGTVIAESVAPNLPQILWVKIDDPCFGESYVDMYQMGRVRAVNDIYQEPSMTDCYQRMLEQFAVKANLVAPILNNNQLLGLLIAHNCLEPRHWTQVEIDFFKS